MCRREQSIDNAHSDGRLALDRNEINKIAQAHRVAKTGRRTDGGWPVTIAHRKGSYDAAKNALMLFLFENLLFNDCGLHYDVSLHALFVAANVRDKLGTSDAGS